MADKVKVGSLGFCVKIIKEYLAASDTDPDLKEKKRKAEKAADYLETILGVAPGEVELLGCSTDLWIQ